MQTFDQSDRNFLQLLAWLQYFVRTLWQEWFQIFHKERESIEEEFAQLWEETHANRKDNESSNQKIDRIEKELKEELKEQSLNIEVEFARLKLQREADNRRHEAEMMELEDQSRNPPW